MPYGFSLPAIVRSVQRSNDAALSAPGGLEEPRGAVESVGAGRDSQNGVRHGIRADASDPMGGSPLVTNRAEGPRAGNASMARSAYH